MAKQQQQSQSSKKFLLLVVLAILAAGGWWLWQTDQGAYWKERILQYIDNRDVTTLEARFLPEELIEAHRQEIGKKTIQNTILKYYPYLLLDVKYPDGTKTREGILLWGLTDGEMVINTETWTTSHGFRDCLNCQANRSDFKVIQAIAHRQGNISLEELQKELKIDKEVIDTWVEGAKKKGLIVQKGSLLQLHFENPRILVTPQTTIKQQLVSKPIGEGQKVPRTYGSSQILAITQAAFGSDFKVRNEQEVYLPVYSIEVLNPDGSIQISEWNALTGQKIVPRYLSN